MNKNIKKQCKKCQEIIDINLFWRNSKSDDGLDIYCILCQKNRNRESYNKNREKRLKQQKEKYQDNPKIKNEICRKSRLKHIEKRREKDKIYYQKNKAAKLKKSKEYHQKNKDKIRQVKKKYYQEVTKLDPQNKIKSNLRRRITLSIKYESKKQKISVVKKHKTEALVGCDFIFYKRYLESLWQEGMSWTNYGNKKNCWQIDHIIPCAAFDLTKEEEQRKCFHYSNTQPLWMYDNLSKSDFLPNGERARDQT